MISGDERVQPSSEGSVNLEPQLQDSLEADTSDALRIEMDAVRADLAKQQDLVVRTLADLDNVRRRAARDRELWQKTATENLMGDIIPALDALLLGLEAAQKNPQAQNIVDGFKMAVDQLERTLTSHGLERINPQYVAFDPNLHECIAHVPAPDKQDGMVLQVVRSGYRLGEKLLRPASVVVAGPQIEDKE